MISAFIFLGLGAGSLIFLLLFLAALIREPRRHTQTPRNADRSLALTIMEQYRRDSHHKRAA